jgi:polar amino acid transport system substrate-binding protein
MFIGSSGVAFAKPLVVATYYVPLMSESSDKGLFVDLTKEIARRNKLDIKIIVSPANQVFLDFANGKVDGFFPALDVNVPTGAMATTPYYFKVDYAFYKKDKPVRSLTALRGKNVGLTFRYPYSRLLMEDKAIQFAYAKSDIDNMKKLDSGTLDAFVAEEQSGLEAMKLAKAKDITFDKKAPLSVQNVYYAFQDSNEGRRLQKIFSVEIERLRKEGKLKTLVGDSCSLENIDFASHSPKISK